MKVKAPSLGGLRRAGRQDRPTHELSLAYVASQRCAIRFDNEAGKGDHKHLRKSLILWWAVQGLNL